MSSAVVLIKENLKAWLRARGLWIIIVAALVPPLLTGAWVATHQDDLVAADLQYEPLLVQAGDTVNITGTIRNDFAHAVGPFNATMRVGYFEETATGLRFREDASQQYEIERLPGGGSRTLMMEWSAPFGTFIVQLLVDTEDVVAEIEERNNDRFVQIQTRVPQVPFNVARDTGRANPGGPAVDAQVVDIRFDPPQVFTGEQTNVTALLRNNGTDDLVNATVYLDVHRLSISSNQQVTVSPTPSLSLDEPTTVPAGEEREVRFAWRPANVGGFLPVVTIDPGDADEANPGDNSRAQPFIVERQVLYEPPEEKATAKDFYRDVLGLLHLRLLIPLIALFFAGSVLADERERGHLPYLLTRPVPRWMLPLTRFATTVLVAGAALLLGVLATLIVLLGAPQAAPGFLYWPVWFTLLALVVYSAVFTLVGVVSSRPHLVGLLYVIGFEAVILIGQSILVNGQPLLQDWVLNLSLNHWVQQAFAGWDPALGAQWTPATDEAWRALWIILGIAVAALASAAWWMQRREFEE